MGDPELMGSPSHVTLLGALQSCYFSLKEGAERPGWGELLLLCQALSEEEILTRGSFNPLNSNRRCGHLFLSPGQGEEGTLPPLLLTHILLCGCTFVCVSLGRLWTLFSWHLSLSSSPAPERVRL